VRLVGVAGFTAMAIAQREPFIDRWIYVHHAGTVPVGTHRFVAQFDVPADAPPTHDSGDSFATLTAIATVNRGALHLDRRELRTIAIRHLSSTKPEAVPIEKSNGAYDDHLVVRLASFRLTRGERIAATVVASRFDHDKPIELVVQLVAVTERRTENLFPMPARTVEDVRGDGATGRPPVDFEIALAAEMTPGFRIEKLALHWELVVKARGRLVERPSVVIPIDIVDVDVEGEIVAPATEKDRVAAAFNALAAKQDWRWHEAVESDAELDTMHLAIEREFRTATLQLAFAYGMPAGPSVIARIGYPSLDLGLDVSPSTPLRELFARDITANVADWDRRHRVTARDEVGATALVRAIVPAILAAPGLGALLRWNDREIEFARVTNDPPLDANAADLERLATAILAAVPSVPHEGVYR